MLISNKRNLIFIIIILYTCSVNNLNWEQYYLKTHYNFFLGELYFGDKAYGNDVVFKTIGGAGGGALIINSRHVDIDGLIAANGNAPDSRFPTGSGICCCIFVVLLKQIKL